MNTVFWVMLLKPFAALAVMVLIVLPIEMLFVRYFPDGKLKRLLLRPIGKR
jgi:hypothetical protein